MKHLITKHRVIFLILPSSVTTTSLEPLVVPREGEIAGEGPAPGIRPGSTSTPRTGTRGQRTPFAHKGSIVRMGEGVTRRWIGTMTDEMRNKFEFCVVTGSVQDLHSLLIAC